MKATRAAIFEFAPVKQLRTDRSWLPQAQGRAVKIIHLLLRELPIDGSFSYRVILMKRPMEEVLASQRAMLERQGKTSAKASVLSKIYQAQLAQAEEWMAAQACFQTLPIDYHRVLENLLAAAGAISDYLLLDLDKAAMAAAVEPALHRQRRGAA